MATRPARTTLTRKGSPALSMSPAVTKAPTPWWTTGPRSTAPAYPARRFQLPARAAHMKITVATRIGYGLIHSGRRKRITTTTPSAINAVEDWRPRGKLLQPAFPHDAGGHEAQDQVEQRERYEERQPGFQVRLRERLGHPERQPAPHDARGVPESAEDDDGEGEQRVGQAHVRLHGRVQRDERAGYARD